VRVIGISADPPETNREHSRKLGYTFTLLSDPSSDVIRRYDLLHEKGGPSGEDISRPAEFLIDSTGTVRWSNLTTSFTVRARPEQVLAVLGDLAPVN
jgi:peroxiredoxin